MTWVKGLEELDRTQVGTVGGKAANLGELARHEDLGVPPGFCVTTGAYRAAVAESPAAGSLLDQLSTLSADDRSGIATLSAQVRELVEHAPVPPGFTAEVDAALARHGSGAAYAVRSSATAEDRPDASFAGQQDSFLDVVGSVEILRNIKRCWASLFTERAVAYRLQHGYGDHDVAMAVVVQRMVAARASGVLFTADPVTADRAVVTVESVPGLGEALVSGTANPDVDTVRAGRIASRRAVSGRGPVLTADELLHLAAIGRRIESLDGRPQDVEWCLADDGFHIVQSRAITTAFPPPVTTDDDLHVYVSVGHQQMMTDAMKPLGLSFWHLTTRAVMVEAAGRLFVDVTPRLAHPASRAALLEVMGRGDPLIRDALEMLLARDTSTFPPATGESPASPVPPAPAAEPAPGVVADLIDQNARAVAALHRAVAPLSGAALFDFLPTAFAEDREILFEPRSLAVIMAGMEATWWLNDHVEEWLGEQNVADALTLSAPHNVTSEMGLALLDVADAIRPHAEVVAYLQHLDDTGRAATISFDDLSDALVDLPGGATAGDALEEFLLHHGMRCAGEIDISRPRWSEQPGVLVPTLLGNIRHTPPGESRRRFAQGEQAAAAKATELLARVRALPGGAARAREVEQAIDRLRRFIGYREYPKYGKIARLAVYRAAVLREAERLVEKGFLRERDDVFFLRYEELDVAVRADRPDPALAATVEERRESFGQFQALTPPRVLTSDGEAVTGSYRRAGLPPGALAGIAVSAGTVEGRARVVLDMAHADLAAGDILVTRFTDPSWTPMFLTVAGLVTEVGGQMTHGAVIAREYGLPAVVGVPDATRLIRDGQRIRVHGNAGFVELLEPSVPR